MNCMNGFKKFKGQEIQIVPDLSSRSTSYSWYRVVVEFSPSELIFSSSAGLCLSFLGYSLARSCLFLLLSTPQTQRSSKADPFVTSQFWNLRVRVPKDVHHECLTGTSVAMLSRRQRTEDLASRKMLPSEFTFQYESVFFQRV